MRLHLDFRGRGFYEPHKLINRPSLAFKLHVVISIGDTRLFQYIIIQCTGPVAYSLQYHPTKPSQTPFLKTRR